MDRIDHPHLHVESCGPPGTLRGHFHSSCPRDGLVWQCGSRGFGFDPPCDTVFAISWEELDAVNEGVDGDTFVLPPCPRCGGVTTFGHNDVYYGLELPEYATMRIVREHILTRPAFRGVRRFPAGALQGQRYQGCDFSNLPRRARPAHHRKIDLHG